MVNDSTSSEPGPDEANGGLAVASPSRRRFLQVAGITLTLAAVGCDDDEPTDPGNGNGDGDPVDLGSGDTGILNYAYALEQLEAAFYAQVITTPYSGMTSEETTILTEIRDHEIVHREFLKAALGTSAIVGLEVDFGTVDFGSRASVLGTAKVFEDLGVGAYNGAGQLLADGDFLLAAGKIVSVEARHASAIRDLLNPNSMDFAGDDIVNTSGLDSALEPPDVLAAADAFVTTELVATSLPTS